MPGRARRLSLLVFAYACAGAPACHRDASETTLSKEEARKIIAEIERRAPAHSSEPVAASSSSGSDFEATFDAPTSSGSVAPTLEPPTVPWILDQTSDLGPPAPAASMPFGVVLHTLDGALSIARLGPLSRSRAAAKTPLGRPNPPGGEFTYGRGSGFFQDHVYWISHGSLVRRSISPRGEVGPLEILARDAHDGTRVGVPLPTPGEKLSDIPATVAYIVRPEKEGAPLLAKLWIEGAPSEVITSEGNSAHSVSLVHTNDGVLVISVQARMAITPVHVRRLRFAARRPALGEDLVVWVGGGIQPLTEMTVLPGGPRDLWGFIPHERSIKEFGLAELDISMNPTMDTPTTWQLYPNGIDPAPVAAGHLCGEPVVLYAEPETSSPDSSQELVLRSIADATGERWAKVAHARAFYEVSLADLPNGALLAWATDESTESMTVRCKERAK